MATVADRAVLDTDVLLSATDEARVDHAAALAAINDWPATGTALYTSGQILREYLAVSTRPIDHNGLGLDRRLAVGNVRALRTRLRILAETAGVADRLLKLLTDVECTGKQVHDANVVATMLSHGVDTLVTINVGDFVRFQSLIRVLALPG